MPTGRVLLPRVCVFVKLVGYHPGRHLNVCNSRINKINILYANPWSLPVSGKIFSYFFKINFHLGGHLVRIIFFLFGFNLSVFNLIPTS